MKGQHRRYSHTFIHEKLVEKWYRGDSYEPPLKPHETSMGEEHQQKDVWRQALFCPYYVTLCGVLGMDWGVIVNPASQKFGEIVFEHDECGCAEPHPGDWQEYDDAWREPVERHDR